MVHPDLGYILGPKCTAPQLSAQQLPALLAPPANGRRTWRPGSAGAGAGAAAAAPGPSDRRPHTAGALRGGDGGAGFPRPVSASRVPAGSLLGPAAPFSSGVPRWLITATLRPGTAVPSRHVGNSTPQVVQQRQRRRRRRRRRRQRPPAPVLSSWSNADITDMGPGARSDGVGPCAAQATPVVSVTRSTVFGSPEDPAAPSAKEMALDTGSRRAREWVSEREESRNLTLRLATHTWQVRRSSRRRLMEDGLTGWKRYVASKLRFVQRCGFAMYVWKRFRTAKQVRRAATKKLYWEFDMLTQRQSFGAWLRWFDQKTSVKKKWQAMQNKKQRHMLRRVIAAMHKWATEAVGTRQRVLSVLLQAQTTWIWRVRFSQLRCWGQCRARRRERRARFGQQLLLRPDGTDHMSRIPALPIPQVASGGVDGFLEAFIENNRRGDIQDLVALQCHFAAVSRRLLVNGWHAYVVAMKRAVRFMRHQLLLRAFRLFRWQSRWQRTQRTAEEEIQAKRNADIAHQRALQKLAEVSDDMRSPHELQATEGRLVLSRPGSAASLAAKQREENEFRSQRASVELAAQRLQEDLHTAATSVSEVAAETSKMMDAHSPTAPVTSVAVASELTQQHGAASFIQKFLRGLMVRKRKLLLLAKELASLLKQLSTVEHEATANSDRATQLKKRIDLGSLEVHVQDSLVSRWRAEQDIERVDENLLLRWRNQLSSLDEEASALEIRCVNLREEIARLRSLAMDAGSPAIRVSVPGVVDIESDSYSDVGEERPQRPSRYDAVTKRVATSVSATEPHLASIRQRQTRVSAEIARIDQHEADLANQLRLRNEKFSNELGRLQAQMERRLLKPGEHPLIAMFQQLCDAFEMALNEVAAARLRNTTISAFLSFAEPVKMRKAGEHFDTYSAAQFFGVWRRFTAMMAAIRNLAHVRFRCCYFTFERWRREARKYRIYCSRGLRREINYRRDVLCRFSKWLRETPFAGYQFGRYSVLARWMEFVQRRVARRELCRLQISARLLSRRRHAFFAMFLGLKPQHQDAPPGYVEKNLKADSNLWKFMLRAEVDLLSDKHRAVNRRELARVRKAGLQHMTVRRRYRVVEERVMLQLQHERALVLQYFEREADLVPDWSPIFHQRTSVVLACFKSMVDWVKQTERSLRYNPTKATVAALCTEKVLPQLALWVMRARLRILHLATLDAHYASPQLSAIFRSIVISVRS